jgi:uncharacterized membrane protein
MLFPVYGIILFIALYLTAAFLYPGGTFHDKSSKGFSWQDNYWCELMAPQAQNGKANTARPVAITAMGILALGLCFFWYTTALLFKKGSAGYYLIRYAGITSAIVWVFFLTGAHDTVVNLSGFFGVLAIITILTGLYKRKWNTLFAIGIICLILCCINNYIYYTTHFFDLLPVIQKISFLTFMYWFCAVSIQMYRRSPAVGSI